VGQSVVPRGLSNKVAIGAGNYHSLALKSDGTVLAWGDNSQGQCLVESRQFANGAIDEDGFGGSVAGEDIGFDGSKQVEGGMWELRQNGLAAYHHEVTLIRDGSRSAEDVLKRRSIHTD
jgi:alpha-tubulin suppressor-like RCC1 family protein